MLDMETGLLVSYLVNADASIVSYHAAVERKVNTAPTVRQVCASEAFDDGVEDGPAGSNMSKRDCCPDVSLWPFMVRDGGTGSLCNAGIVVTIVCLVICLVKVCLKVMLKRFR